MRYLGYQEIRSDELTGLPDDWDERIERAKTSEIGGSVKRFGLLSPPLVRLDDLRIITGRDRFAAAVAAGEPLQECRVIECSDHEAYLLERIENAHRRHNPAEQNRLLSELVDAYEMGIDPAEQPKADHRPKSRRGLARKRVAEDMGIKESEVKRRDLAHKNQEPKKEQPKVPKLQTFGLELTGEFYREVDVVYSHTLSAQLAVESAIGDLKKLMQEDVDMPRSKLETACMQLRTVVEQVKFCKPLSLCPYCKGQEGLQELCNQCDGRGWVGKMGGVPAELLTAEPLKVVKNGAIVELDAEPELDW